jgi:DNA-binding winged helix-turn-helix (wHTH) protein
MSAHWCPRCGQDFEKAQGVTVGRLRVALSGVWPVTCDGRPVKVSTGQRLILYSLAAANGEFVRRDILAARSGIDRGKSFDVTMSKLRAALRSAGLPNAIENENRVGYRLAIEMCS